MKRLLLISLLLPFFTIAQTGCISGDCENGYGTYVWPDGEKNQLNSRSLEVIKRPGT